MPQSLTDENFDAVLSQTPGMLAVRFSADWCGPCKMMAPIFDQLADELQDKAAFGVVNVDHAPDTAEKYGVQTIPTLLLFQQGEMIDRMTGSTGKDNILRFLTRHAA
ncbi:thioredoxin [Sphingobium sp.]|uniref:thioredoxin n=1 Tax=Sphingobium sp. TaxID=1912891 RepID=UPI00262AB970|nr:thioredoxin [Sphingobium sp.]